MMGQSSVTHQDSVVIQNPLDDVVDSGIGLMGRVVEGIESGLTEQLVPTLFKSTMSYTQRGKFYRPDVRLAD